LGIFIGISIFLIDIPIKIYLKFSKSDLSVFEWLFLRKIKNKRIYQAKDFITQYSFFTIFRTSFYYIIQVTSALYTLYYGIIIAFGVEIKINTVEIIMGLLALVIFVNTLFWNYYKRELFLNELGLVVEDRNSKLIKKVSPSLFEKPLKRYLSAALVFSILTTLPEISQIISNLSDYYDLILSFSLLPAFFILQSILFYIELRIKGTSKELKSDLLRKNKIETCKIKVQVTPIPHNDFLSS